MIHFFYLYNKKNDSFFYLYNKMESKSLTLTVILNQLRQTEEYKNLGNSYIKNKIKDKYSLHRVNKPELLIALRDAQHVIIPRDMINVISHYMDIPTARLLDKQALNMNQQRYNIQVEKRKAQFLFALNELSKYYHAYYGFDWAPEVYEQYDPNDDYFQQLIHFGLPTFVNEVDRTVVHDLNGLIEGEEYKMVYTPEFLKSKAQMIVPYKTVILQENLMYYSNTPSIWYNKPSRNWTKKKGLPYLKTRPYIVVNKPFTKITISADQKGSPLTMDDLLFAARGLTADDTMTITEGVAFQIMHDTGDTVIIELVSIDIGEEDS